MGKLAVRATRTLNITHPLFFPLSRDVALRLSPRLIATMAAAPLDREPYLLIVFFFHDVRSTLPKALIYYVVS